jgi:hypothetical protein
MFKFNYIQTLTSLVPFRHRKPKFLSWLFVFIKPIDKLKSEFLQYREDKLFLLSHNSQVRSLEHLLNTTFNNGELGIFITPSSFLQEQYAYNRSENRDPRYLYNKAEAGSATYLRNAREYRPEVTFLIWIPEALELDEARLIALVNRFRLAGKQFAIRRYTNMYQIKFDNRVCVASFEDFTIRWGQRQCILSPISFDLEWSGRQCIGFDTAYSIDWDNKLCVLESSGYLLEWNGRQCVLTQDVLFTLAWSERQCNLVDVDLYDLQWSDRQCNLVEGFYSMRFSQRQCVLTDIDFQLSWNTDSRYCTLDRSADVRWQVIWKGRECVLTQQLESKN